MAATRVWLTVINNDTTAAILSNRANVHLLKGNIKSLSSSNFEEKELDNNKQTEVTQDIILKQENECNVVVPGDKRQALQNCFIEPLKSQATNKIGRDEPLNTQLLFNLRISQLALQNINKVLEAGYNLNTMKYDSQISTSNNKVLSLNVSLEDSGSNQLFGDDINRIMKRKYTLENNEAIKCELQNNSQVSVIKKFLGNNSRGNIKFTSYYMQNRYYHKRMEERFNEEKLKEDKRKHKEEPFDKISNEKDNKKKEISKEESNINETTVNEKIPMSSETHESREDSQSLNACNIIDDTKKRNIDFLLEDIYSNFLYIQGTNSALTTGQSNSIRPGFLKHNNFIKKCSSSSNLINASSSTICSTHNFTKPFTDNFKEYSTVNTQGVTTKGNLKRGSRSEHIICNALLNNLNNSNQSMNEENKAILNILEYNSVDTTDCSKDQNVIKKSSSCSEITSTDFVFNKVNTNDVNNREIEGASMEKQSETNIGSQAIKGLMFSDYLIESVSNAISGYQNDNLLKSDSLHAQLRKDERQKMIKPSDKSNNCESWEPQITMKEFEDNPPQIVLNNNIDPHTSTSPEVPIAKNNINELNEFLRNSGNSNYTFIEALSNAYMQPSNVWKQECADNDQSMNLLEHSRTNVRKENDKDLRTESNMCDNLINNMVTKIISEDAMKDKNYNISHDKINAKKITSHLQNSSNKSDTYKPALSEKKLDQKSKSGLKENATKKHINKLINEKEIINIESERAAFKSDVNVVIEKLRRLTNISKSTLEFKNKTADIKRENSFLRKDQTITKDPFTQFTEMIHTNTLEKYTIKEQLQYLQNKINKIKFNESYDYERKNLVEFVPKPIKDNDNDGKEYFTKASKSLTEAASSFVRPDKQMHVLFKRNSMDTTKVDAIKTNNRTFEMKMNEVYSKSGNEIKRNVDDGRMKHISKPVKETPILRKHSSLGNINWGNVRTWNREVDKFVHKSEYDYPKNEYEKKARNEAEREIKLRNNNISRYMQENSIISKSPQLNDKKFLKNYQNLMVGSAAREETLFEIKTGKQRLNDLKNERARNTEYNKEQMENKTSYDFSIKIKPSIKHFDSAKRIRMSKILNNATEPFGSRPVDVKAQKQLFENFHKKFKEDITRINEKRNFRKDQLTIMHNKNNYFKNTVGMIDRTGSKMLRFNPGGSNFNKFVNFNRMQQKVTRINAINIHTHNLKNIKQEVGMNNKGNLKNRLTNKELEDSVSKEYNIKNEVPVLENSAKNVNTIKRIKSDNNFQTTEIKTNLRKTKSEVDINKSINFVNIARKNNTLQIIHRDSTKLILNIFNKLKDKAYNLSKTLYGFNKNTEEIKDNVKTKLQEKPVKKERTEFNYIFNIPNKLTLISDPVSTEGNHTTSNKLNKEKELVGKSIKKYSKSDTTIIINAKEKEKPREIPRKALKPSDSFLWNNFKAEKHNRNRTANKGNESLKFNSKLMNMRFKEHRNKFGELGGEVLSQNVNNYYSRKIKKSSYDIKNNSNNEQLSRNENVEPNYYSARSHYETITSSSAKVYKHFSNKTSRNILEENVFATASTTPHQLVNATRPFTTLETSNKPISNVSMDFAFKDNKHKEKLNQSVINYLKRDRPPNVENKTTNSPRRDYTLL